MFIASKRRYMRTAATSSNGPYALYMQPVTEPNNPNNRPSGSIITSPAAGTYTYKNTAGENAIGFILSADPTYFNNWGTFQASYIAGYSSSMNPTRVFVSPNVLGTVWAVFN